MSPCAGSSGAFVGSNEEIYAILSAEGQQISLYSSSPMLPDGKNRRASQPKPAAPVPLKRIGILGASALFAGPAWATLPRFAKHLGIFQPQALPVSPQSL